MSPTGWQGGTLVTARLRRYSTNRRTDKGPVAGLPSRWRKRTRFRPPRHARPSGVLQSVYSDGMESTPFRALFLLRDSLNHLEVVPLGGVQASPGSRLGGVLSGRQALLTFIREIGFDSIVESYQVTDTPRTGFLYTFHLASSADSIVDLLSQRLLPKIRATHRVLALSHEKAPEQLTLSPHEAFQLGASTLPASEGIARVRDWFASRKVPVA